jgi:hypothetical protein
MPRRCVGCVVREITAPLSAVRADAEYKIPHHRPVFVPEVLGHDEPSSSVCPDRVRQLLEQDPHEVRDRTLDASGDCDLSDPCRGGRDRFPIERCESDALRRDAGEHLGRAALVDRQHESGGGCMYPSGQGLADLAELLSLLRLRATRLAG